MQAAAKEQAVAPVTNSVRVEIFDQAYNLRGTDPEYIRRLAEFVDGKMRLIASAYGKRVPSFPDTPTLIEQGYPGIGTNAWQGMFAPSATPKPVVQKLYQSVAAVLGNPAMKADLAKKMLTVTLSASPEDFQKLVVKETQDWGEFLRQAKLKLQ